MFVLSTSKRHVASIAQHVADEVRKVGLQPARYGRSKKKASGLSQIWGPSMLHVMQEEHRELYQLEKLWS
ncbi:RsfS/YbeB/iojap family protein [Vibrio splendidus]